MYYCLLTAYLGEKQQRVAVLELPVVGGQLGLGVGLLRHDALHVRGLALGLSQVFLRRLDKIQS